MARSSKKPLDIPAKTPKPDSAANPEPAAPAKSFAASAREWADAIIIAYVLAMFIRTFGVELFKIPTGSMTPMLIGDYVSEVDYNGDGQRDLLVLKDDPSRAMRTGRWPFQIFLRKGKEWVYEGKRDLDDAGFARLQELAHSRYKNPILKPLASWRGWDQALRHREDRILVNKFAYWFHPPRRGDLVVFKIPLNIWDETKPTYIKRAVALGGETATIVPAGRSSDGDALKGRLAIDGQIVNDPPVFQRLYYSSLVRPEVPAPENEYYPPSGAPGTPRRFEACHVPPGNFLPLGDNTDHSLDGRYWGTVPCENLRGKAFLRFWPLTKFRFLG